MPTKTRLANKTQWALLDTIALCKDARVTWDKAIRQAEQNLDPRMLLLLVRLRDDIVKIEDISKAALKGEYEERGEP